MAPNKLLILNLTKMKNLKKLSRGEMKEITGGKNFGWFACCIVGVGCSAVVLGEATDLFCQKGVLVQV